MDIAGTIDEIGDDVNAESGLAIGDVVGVIDNHGGYSECIVLDARSVTPKPARADFLEAASFLMNALTVRTALDALALLPGPTLLVTGAAGAFGGCAVQLGAAECLHVRGRTEMRAGTGARSWSADNCRAAAHRRGGARR
jgi:NADPH2:quinone reductase